MSKYKHAFNVLCTNHLRTTEIPVKTVYQTGEGSPLKFNTFKATLYTL